MSDDIMGHDWAEVRDGWSGAPLTVISYVCQSCGHTEAATQIICRPGEAKHFEAKFGADQVRESPYAPLGPGEAYAIDGRTACQVACSRPAAPVFRYVPQGWVRR